jgi:hypothetical protein
MDKLTQTAVLGRQISHEINQLGNKLTKGLKTRFFGNCCANEKKAVSLSQQNLTEKPNTFLL